VASPKPLLLIATVPWSCADRCYRPAGFSNVSLAIRRRIADAVEGIRTAVLVHDDIVVGDVDDGADGDVDRRRFVTPVGEVTV
jgi:hypothetical protein